MKISLLSSPEALVPRRDEWQALVERSATNTIFQTLEWQRCWWNALGGGVRPLFLIAEEAGKLVGAAPLMISEQRILGRRRRVVEFIGTHAADYSDFVLAPGRDDVLAELLEWLVGHGAEWDLLHLINIAETSPLPAALKQAFGPRGCAVEVKPLYECPTRLLNDPEADARLLKKRRLRPRFEWLRRPGALQFEVHCAPEDIEPRLDAFFGQHVERWAGTPTPSFFLDARQRAFYREKVRLLAPGGWVVFSVLSHKGLPISFHFGFRYGGRVMIIKPAFDPRYSDAYPGILQTRHLLEYAMASGAQELDFTTGEESYKYNFTNHARVNYAARVYPRWLFYGIDRVLVRAKEATQRAGPVRRLGKRLVGPWLGDSLRRLGL